ncbi:methyltransferase domain-containing protein [Streptacidiphilus neutrinimicus]|uniref:methyltransferase domain-containing protein n=1 Tax=Streptacidiphilus neutrinimicus TaxID=105420 RepID=UPI0005A7B1B0|nr:methyltransferase domain-containing protein [Streptacidiphilus neutrinimicus]
MSARGGPTRARTGGDQPPAATALRLLAAAARHGVGDPAYQRLHAAYRVRRLDRLFGLADRQVVAVGTDVWRADAFRTAGARCLAVEPGRADHARSASAGAAVAPEAGAGARVVADGYWLPVKDAAADLAYCDGALPGGPDAVGVVDELVRVTRVGGLVCLSLIGVRGPLVRHLRRREDLALLTRPPIVRLLGRRTELVLRRTA